LAKEHGVTLYQLTSFDMTQPRFAPWYVRFCINHGLKLDSRIDPPIELFATAERLSRMKILTKNRKRYRKPGLWPLLCRMFSS
jgi:hypothetical protein